LLFYPLKPACEPDPKLAYWTTQNVLHSKNKPQHNAPIKISAPFMLPIVLGTQQKSYACILSIKGGHAFQKILFWTELFFILHKRPNGLHMTNTPPEKITKCLIVNNKLRHIRLLSAINPRGFRVEGSYGSDCLFSCSFLALIVFIICQHHD
jgi:hypothetical protein